MNKNKKRLHITENEDGFKFSEKKRIVSFNRIAFLFFFILFIFLLYSTKIAYLGSSTPKKTYPFQYYLQSFQSLGLETNTLILAKIFFCH